ncbi:dethiobiotin synthase [Corynebacterium freiburgense]|uniref:dethiobiotin synthase n=1 Tax=Corynebacterium freiburgense TaxID=556548 RepID=UPI0004057858|nr:dethiobiotin synthase [Corynebacterium freiburgense]WJZ02555.1 ATP-dependent dethiobiotin synthetase BioD [Corynebacterium freiburgense]
MIIVTGTNTDVGKTIATAALVARIPQALPIKPIQTGEPDGSGDIVTIERLTGVLGTEFIRYPEPLAPNIAAQRANMEQLELRDVAMKIRELNTGNTTPIIEGAGGLLVRMAEDWTIADLAAELDADVVIVTSLGLGSLNAAELTVEAARRRKLRILGLIGGVLPAEPDLATMLNIAELPRVTRVPLLGCLPAGAGEFSAAEFAQIAAKIRIPGY